MSDWISTLRKSISTLSPALAFSVGLTFLAIGFAGTKIQPLSTFCTADELTWIVCARNWMNAIGNMLVVLVALGAAFFTFRQWKAADFQAEITLIPKLDHRLDCINEAIVIGRTFIGTLDLIETHLGFIEFDYKLADAQGTNESKDIVRDFMFLQGHIKNLDKSELIIERYSKDIHNNVDLVYDVKLIGNTVDNFTSSNMMQIKSHMENLPDENNIFDQDKMENFNTVDFAYGFDNGLVELTRRDTLSAIDDINKVILRLEEKAKIIKARQSKLMESIT